MRVVLPSNASSTYYPNNTLAEFTVKLPQHLDFSNGTYEVGLHELSFYRSWNNVRDAHLTVTVLGDTEVHKISLANGYYKTAEKLIEELNTSCQKQCPENIGTFKFNYNEITRSCNITVKLITQSRITFSTNLSRLLGNPKVKLHNQDNDRQELENSLNYSMESADTVKLNDLYNVMVYTNIVEHGIVGGVNAPLLRAVAVTGEHWKQQCTIFDKIQYLPVTQELIESISIFLYTDYGEKVPFLEGRTVVTLKFRRVKPSFL